MSIENLVFFADHEPGFEGQWEVLETTKKIYVIYQS
jgi:uncharacterized cupin superfamily protein